MTPEEKALKLVHDMYFAYGEVSMAQAKQCALIAVNEIINNFGLLTEGKAHYSSSSTVKYYEQVKQEIEKL